MTVCASPDEETRRTPLAARSFRANAFRVLSTAADAESKLIDRQKQRLLIEIELNPFQVAGAFGLKSLIQEEVLEAVHLVEMPDSRLIEELFWVHVLDCDLNRERSALLLAVRRQPPGAVARHNLAVLQAIVGQEAEPNAWEEALKVWKSVLNDSLFWDFMKDRAGLIGARNSHAAKLKAEVSKRLSGALATQLVLAGKANDATAVTLLAKMVLPHRDWLDLDAVLESVGGQVSKEGFVSLGAVLDRVGELRPEDNNASIRRVLAQGEKELGCVAASYGGLICTLGEMAVEQSWEAAVCSSYQQLLLSSFRLSGEAEQSQRLMEQARVFVSDPQLLESLQRDWRQIQWSLLYREASALLQAGNYGAAEQKLGQALAFSTREQKQQIEALQETCGFARAAAGQQRRLEQRNRLCWEAKVCVQKGEFAAAEQKLAAAISFSSEEEKAEIEAMRERWHCLRLLRGFDTKSTRPALYRICGIGTAFLGRRDYDTRTHSYLTDHWLTFFFLPVYPLGTYRVSRTEAGSYSVYGRASLSSSLRKTQVLVAAIVLVLPLGGAMFSIGFARKTVAIAPPATAAIPLPHPVGDELLPERNAMAALAHSLGERQSSLEREKSEMERQWVYLQSVASAYYGEAVPQDGQAIYDGLLVDYNSKVQQHKRKLTQWLADDAAYRDRVDALNARVDAFHRLR